MKRTIHAALIAALLASASGFLAAAGSKDGKEGAVHDRVEVTFRHSIADGRLTIEYSIVNHTAAPIVAFDRKWDPKTRALDENWAYVEIAGRTAALKRAQDEIPAGLSMDAPPAPMGREIAAGAAGTGTFSVDLPLKQAGAFDVMQRRQATVPVSIEKLRLKIGWCAKSALDAASKTAPTRIGGEMLRPLTFWEIRGVQKLADSPEVAATLSGLAAAKP